MPFSMITASIGAQLFNTWQANKKSEELQIRQREFQQAAQLHDFDRMRRLQREAAQLALELEAEVHRQRLEDIEASYDDILFQFANDFTIKLWPLKVLPFVMKGESFGINIRGNQSIALHCILTPSNCDSFNDAIYDDLDLRLECMCNEHWNAQSSHPIVYYGGGWRKSKFDLDDVNLLHTRLKSIPTVVITPYFDPALHFRIKFWGMGKDSDVRIDIPDGMFAYDYHKEMDYFPKGEEPIDDLYNHTIEEFVPYLQCLIGFIADKYFWEMYSVYPAIPHMFSQNEILCTPSIKRLIVNNYNDEISIAINRVKNARLAYHEAKELIEQFGSLIPEDKKKEFINEILPYEDCDCIDESESNFIECYIDKQVDRVDILDIITQYEEYIDRNSTFFNKENTLLVIEYDKNKSLYIRILDSSTKKTIELSEKFNFHITFNRMAREKNVKSIFCRIAKQGVLVIDSTNLAHIKNRLQTLIY